MLGRQKEKESPKPSWAKGEFLSEELKEFLREVEELHGLAPGQLARTIEGRLKTIREPSVEQMREAIKKEIRACVGRNTSTELIVLAEPLPSSNC